MLNKVMLMGNLGHSPEVKFMPSGDQITSISLATTERYKDKSGQKVEKTEWHKVIFFGKVAEIAGQYLEKGSTCYIEGKIQTRKWEKDGVTRYSTEIIASELKLLSRKTSETNERPVDTNKQTPVYDDYDEEDIPF